MRTGRVIACAALALVVVAMFVGPRRSRVRNLAPATVGSVVIDSATRVSTLRAVEDLRLSGHTQDFVSFSRITVAPNGTIVVPQGQDYGYRFYSATGQLIKRLGRRGRGPGEFRTTEGGIGWMGDTLWIWDGAQRRLTYVSTNGEYLDDESLHTLFSAPRDWFRYPPLMQVARVEAVRDGEYLAFVNEWKFGVAASWLALRRPLVAVGSSGLLRRMVGDFPWAADSDVVSIKMSGPRPYESALPLRAMPHYDVADDGSRIAYLTTRVTDAKGGMLRLTVVATSGDTLLSREYPFVGEAIPARVSDSIVRFRSARRTGRPDLVAMWRDAAPRRVQPVYAPVYALVAGRDSTTWIGLRTTTSKRVWVILDALGEPIGSVTLPVGARVGAAERAQIWCVEVDANDLPSVVRYRVEGWGM